MTMQIGAVFPDGVRLWTDTAIRKGDTLEVIGHAPKAFYGTLFPFAGVLSTCGGPATSIAEAIGKQLSLGLDALLKASILAMREYIDAGGQHVNLLLGGWDGRPRMFFISSLELPGIQPAFEPLEKTIWFHAAPNCAAYRQGMENGFTPQHAHDAVIAAIDAPYENGLDGRSAPWVAGNIVEITVTEGGTEQRIVRTNIPDRLSLEATGYGRRAA